MNEPGSIPGRFLPMDKQQLEESINKILGSAYEAKKRDDRLLRIANIAQAMPWLTWKEVTDDLDRMDANEKNIRKIVRDEIKKQGRTAW